ncbi:MAG: sigma-70 family RNA polymerase sigma factor [Clostridia bacterium]|nr:sigma-70 family RNA polymerase sigma factor [Clostridia bacterium]
MNKIMSAIARLYLKLFSKGAASAHYINGPCLLPPPLSPEEEAQYIEKAESDPAARNVLIEHNLRLVVYIAKKFECPAVGIEDLISIGTIGLMKAVNTFKCDKQIKLATYASRCIENEILMYMRKIGGKTELSLDEPLNTDWDGNELLLSDILGTENDYVYSAIENDEEKKIIRQALSKLSDRDRLIIEKRFGFGSAADKELTQKEVADLLGISQSYISRLEKRIIDKLKEELCRLGMK